jgi:hypothetical protein
MKNLEKSDIAQQPGAECRNNYYDGTHGKPSPFPLLHLAEILLRTRGGVRQ